MKTEGKYRSTLIAKYMMAYANDKDIDMNVTKLNKLLYALYGVYLAMTDERLTDEQPQAWPYGPVFKNARFDFLVFAKPYWLATLSNAEFDELKKDDKLTACLKATMDYYGKYNATSLVNWSHADGSPWKKTTEGDSFEWGDTISDEDTQNYFKDICAWKK